MPATPTPGSHYRTPTGRRFRVDSVQGSIVHAVFTTPSGSDCGGNDGPVMFSVAFVQGSCRPVSAGAVAQAFGAEA